jgi:hypothetical protein
MERQAHTMTATERVLAACRFQRPNRIPRFDGFWSYPQEWRDRFGDPAGLSDIAIWVPLEGTFPTRLRNLREEGGYLYSVDEWGRTIRSRPGAFFYETLEVPLAEGTHSISPEIPLEHFAAYDRVCRTYGDFTSQETPHERR